MSTDQRSNKYRDVLITAKRARQLQGGATAQIISKSMKVCRVAQEELAAGKIDANSVGFRMASDEPEPEAPPEPSHHHPAHE